MKRVMGIRRFFLILRWGRFGCGGGETDFSTASSTRFTCSGAGWNDDFICWVVGMVERGGSSSCELKQEKAKAKAKPRARAKQMPEQKQILRLRRRMTTKKTKAKAKSKTEADPPPSTPAQTARRDPGSAKDDSLLEEG